MPDLTQVPIDNLLDALCAYAGRVDFETNGLVMLTARSSAREKMDALVAEVKRRLAPPSPPPPSPEGTEKYGDA